MLSITTVTAPSDIEAAKDNLKTWRNYCEGKVIPKTATEIRVLLRDKKTLSKEEHLERMYVSARSVSRYSYYILKDRKLDNFFIDIAWDESSTMRGFALSKKVTLPSIDHPRKTHTFIFLQYLTSDPTQFESASRVKGVGASLLFTLFQRCVKEKYDGIMSEPVLTVMPYFTSLGFFDTRLRRKESKRTAMIIDRQTIHEHLRYGLITNN